MNTEWRGLVPVFLRELRRAASRPTYLLVTLVMPVLTMGAMIALFQRSVPRDLPIAICDQDNTSFSRRLARWIDATPSLRVDSRVRTFEEGRDLILKGGAYGLVMLPPNLERDVFRGHAPKIVVYYNNQFMMTGSIVQREAMAAIITLSTGVNLQTRMKRGETPLAAMNHAVPIQVDTHMLFNPYSSYAYYVISALLPSLLQIFMIVTTVFVLGIELKERTAAEWLDRAGGSVIKAVAGKLLLYTLSFLFLGLAADAFLFQYLGLPMQGNRHALLVGLLVFILAYQSLGLFFLALLANMRVALSAAALYSAPAMAFAGATFPVLAMPALAKFWSSMLPLTYYLKLFQDQSLRGAPWRVSFPALLVLIVFASAGPVLMLPRMKKLMKNECYWGRS